MLHKKNSFFGFSGKKNFETKKTAREIFNCVPKVFENEKKNCSTRQTFHTHYFPI